MLDVRKTIFRHALTGLLLVSIYAVIPALVMAQGTTSYVYDDNGRLHAVISPSGEAAVYEYDAAGNFTAIRRLTANDLVLFLFSPHSGLPGDLVTFTGVGFGAGVSAVSFNGTAAQIVAVTPPTVVAQVPQGATTGPITITTPNGSVTTPVPFTVEGIRLSPSTIELLSGDSAQFTATVVLGGDQSLKWSVNTIGGGNASVGTITADGLYTAPNLPSNVPSSVFSVRATSNAMPQVFGQAQVTVRNPEFTRLAFAPAVSVQNGNTSTISILPTSAGVSVQNGATSTLSILPVSAGVSVQNGDTSIISVLPTSAGVSATNGPNISAIAPNSIKAGATVTITINGANLLGATNLTFIDGSGALDSSIAVSNITVNADGTSLTATLNVGGSDAPGQRIVIVSTAAGHSLTGNVGSNVIEIAP